MALVNQRDLARTQRTRLVAVAGGADDDCFDVEARIRVSQPLRHELGLHERELVPTRP